MSVRSRERYQLIDHPEDLLDLACRGAISDLQRRELDLHLTDCSPCATQLRMADRRSAQEAANAADARLERVAVNQALLQQRRSRWGTRSSVRRWVPIGVGTLLLSSAALAATWWSVHSIMEESPGSSPPPPVRVVKATARRSRPAVPVDPMPSLDVPAAPEGLTEVVSAEPSRPMSAAFGKGADLALDRGSAASLFARARKLRLEGNSDGALTIYRRLQRSYADSRESRLSYLIAGRMLLDGGRPDLAVTQFSRYLDTRGSASAEALLGRATAFARMGRVSEERADWQTLLSDHDKSVYAGRARARLNELARLPARPGHPPGSP